MSRCFLIGSIRQQLLICIVGIFQTVIFLAGCIRGKVCNMIRNCNVRLSVLLSCSCCRFRNIKTTIYFADYDRNFFSCTNLIGIHRCPEQIPTGCIFRTSHIGPCSGSQQTAAAFRPDFLINSCQHIRLWTLRIYFKISFILVFQLIQYTGSVESCPCF